jgi:hypothetical protein
MVAESTSDVLASRECAALTPLPLYPGKRSWSWNALSSPRVLKADATSTTAQSADKIRRTDQDELATGIRKWSNTVPPISMADILRHPEDVR